MRTWLIPLLFLILGSISAHGQDENLRLRWERSQERLRLIAEQNMKEAELFLSKNKNKEGVVTLRSGVQYLITKRGNGPTPSETSPVELRYRCMLVNGTELPAVFPSPYARLDSTIKNPDVYDLQMVLPEVRQVLMLMPVGSQWKIFLPPNLAGFVSNIPNVVHIYDIELIGTK